MMVSKIQNWRSDMKYTYCSANKKRDLESEDAFAVTLQASMAHTARIRVALIDAMVQEVSKICFAASNASQKMKFYN